VTSAPPGYARPPNGVAVAVGVRWGRRFITGGLAATFEKMRYI
jgi:hypothetical protein